VPFLAQRRFAAGRRYFGGSYGADPEGEQLALRRLQTGGALFALIPSDAATAFTSSFPALAAHLGTRYATLANVSANENLSVRVLVDRDVVADARDAATGWPCFVPPTTSARIDHQR
jgi:hypothetical protein